MSEHEAPGVAGPPRFDPDADTIEGARRYFLNRAVQGLADGFHWEGAIEPLLVDGLIWGARTWATGPDGVRRQSVYVLAGARGAGHLSRHLASTRDPFVTAPSCELEALFTKRHVPHVVAGRFSLWPEYRAVEARHHDRYAKRSGLPYMNHIDEGLAVLRDLGASERAQRAFCLHPLLQADDALAATWPDVTSLTDDARVLALALEYRHVANSYLSHREVKADAEVALSPLAEVNDMLRADKVQNAKDFLLHHRTTHPRREALARYFHTWHRRLDLRDDDFARWFTRLQVGPTLEPLPVW
jgi:hypothetical protein